MKLKYKYKKLIWLTLFIVHFFSPYSYAEYPSTIVGVIDLNYILSDSKAAKDAANQIEKIALEIEEEIQKKDQDLIDEQNELIASQQIMAPAAFDEKRKEYEKKVQNYNIVRQERLMSIDMLVTESRNNVLGVLKPILESIANEKGITVLLEKNTVLLNAENMDITDEALKILDKELPSIEVKLN
jgi:outer membrane protein